MVSFKIKAKRELYLHFWLNYCDTSHSPTGVSPAQMIFQDGYQSNLLHKSLSDQEINTARIRDQKKKLIGRISDCYGTRTHNHLVSKQTLNHLTKHLEYRFTLKLVCDIKITYSDRENVYTSCRLKKDFSFQIDDCILIKNYRQHSKFDP